MGLRRSDDSESRFAAYVEGLASVIGHADRAGPLRDYCVGLMMPCERKSVEPMAAVTAPERTAAQHQSLLHFVGEGRWSDEKVLGQGARDGAAGDRAPWADRGVDHRRHGLSQDRAGTRSGWRGNIAASSASRTIARSRCRCRSPITMPACRWPIGCICRRLGGGRERRRKTGVPEEIGFKTKPEIALEQIRAACEAGLPRGVVLMDAGYGSNTDLRTEHQRAGVDLCGRHPVEHHGVGAGHGAAAAEEVVGPRSAAEADAPRRKHQTDLGQGACARLAQARLAHDRMARRLGRTAVLALCARCAFVSPIAITISPRAGPEEWLLIEWPKGEKEPTKYWLSTLPQDITFRRLVDLAKLRWRIERDYQELKQEVGLGHFEGRGWRGFHHHATLCIAAYGFLISERETIPPSGPRSTALFPATCRSRRLPTQRLRRCGPNATSRTRSRPCDGD